MKLSFFLLFFIFFSFHIYSQVNFESGYFINNSDQKVTCLIKNTEWRNNPATFTYKIDENSPEQQAGITEVKEYGVGENVRFVRKTVPIDQTSDKFRDLDSNKEPVFLEKQVFLRQLLEGNAASLYVYQDPQVRRFFYSKDNAEPKAFIFKNYLTADNKVATNQYYKQQLLNDFNCGNLRATDFTNTEYNQQDLLKVLKNYNTCRGETFEQIEAGRAPGKFSLAIKAGVNHSSFSVEQVEWERTIEIEEKLTYTFGLEGEFLLPSFNQKVAFIAGAFFTSYSSSGEGTFYNGTGAVPPPTFMGTRADFNISYSSIELPLGFRYFLHLGPRSKMTLTAAYSPSITFDDSEIYSKEGERLKPDFKLDSFQPANFLIGAGYEYNSRISLEARYFPRKNMVYGDEWNGGQKSYISVLLGYKIL